MISVLCLITVTVLAPLTDKISVPIMTQAQVHGVIKNIPEDSHYYIVDFSKEAKKKNYIGDYEERMVDESLCVKLK